jgi:hypothetical protein
MRKENVANVRWRTYSDILEVHFCGEGVEADPKREQITDY